MTNYILINATLIAICAYYISKLRHGLHILQLESYKNERYIKWIKNNKIITPRELLLIIPLIIMIFNPHIGLAVNIVVIMLLYLGRNTNKEKKPFVITYRIKRMYYTTALILLIIIILSNIYMETAITYILLVILNLSVIFSYLKVIEVNIINSPIERKIQQKFYNKARRKLKQMPDLKIIGITGSYGKTSTKHIITTILSQRYNVLMTPESYNTTMGVVKTINEQLLPTHEIFVCEMGAKNIGDIKEICDLVNPDYGLLTAIGPQHLETFKTIDNVKKTKLELVDSLDDNGIAFLNYEDENIRTATINKHKITFGINPSYDYYAYNIVINEKGSNFDIHTKFNEIISVKTRLLGMLNIINIVGAVAVARELGVNTEDIRAGVRFLKTVPHRLELKQNPNGSLIIDDAYNSNIQGAKMALDVLKTFNNRYKILITPGIVDLGKYTEQYNKEVGIKAAECADFIILVGEKQAEPILKGLLEKGYSKEKIYIAKDLKEALEKMRQIITPNSVILLENDLPDNYL